MPQLEPDKMSLHSRSNQQLARRVEEASLNAWPALQQLFYDGWVLRFAKGFTKRANSIVPLYPPIDRNADNIEQRVRYCENLYAREGLQSIFRLTSINPYPDLDSFLARRGYQLLDPTVVQILHLGAAHPPIPTSSAGRPQDQAPTRFAVLGLEPWLDTYALLADVPDPARRLHGAILGGIQGYCGYGVLYAMEDGGEVPVACGLAVSESKYVGLFDIITREDKRNLGYGRKLVSHLLDWSQTTAGAEMAYLQMIRSNVPAAALYRSLGFVPLYDYWYRAG